MDWKLIPEGVTITERSVECSFTFEGKTHTGRGIWVKHGETMRVAPPEGLTHIQKDIDKLFDEFIDSVQDKTLEKGKQMMDKLDGKQPDKNSSGKKKAPGEVLDNGYLVVE